MQTTMLSMYTNSFFINYVWMGLFGGLRDILSQLNVYTTMKMMNPNPTLVQDFKSHLNKK